MWSVWQGLVLQLRRWQYRQRVQPVLQQCWLQTPKWRSGSVEQYGFLAIDLETSSLSVRDGEVVSMGWVAIDGGEIQLSSARHFMVLGAQSVGRSAEIHQLRDCERESGFSVTEAMTELIRAAQGRVLLFHNASLDMDFLNALSLTSYGAPLLLPYIDTLEQERQRLLRHRELLKAGELRLANCRRRYHLPDYPAHNAFNDALATAELFLAQCGDE